nr:hypothetical protein SYMBAF_20179 [Serratia symbiotica]
MRNARELVIDIHSLIITHNTTTRTFTDIYYVYGIACFDQLPFCDKLFNHNALDTGINVG